MVVEEKDGGSDGGERLLECVDEAVYAEVEVLVDGEVVDSGEGVEDVEVAKVDRGDVGGEEKVELCAEDVERVDVDQAGEGRVEEAEHGVDLADHGGQPLVAQLVGVVHVLGAPPPVLPPALGLDHVVRVAHKQDHPVLPLRVQIRSPVLLRVRRRQRRRLLGKRLGKLDKRLRQPHVPRLVVQRQRVGVVVQDRLVLLSFLLSQPWIKHIELGQ